MFQTASTNRVAPVVESLTDLVGCTPLLQLHCFDEEIRCTLFAKLESSNPGGSIKDRTALALIEYGERNGLLKPGGVIVEPTSGNTGVGLALIAARRGYKCIFTVLDKVSDEKIALLRAYGAEVVVCPTAVAPEHPDSYYSVAERIAKEIEGAYQPNQYANLANQEIHYATTGPEIWEQTQGRISHFVAGAGTGGTISGVGRFLKEQNGEVEIVCADPIGSVYSGSDPRPYLVEGVGEDFVPANYDKSIITGFEAVSDAESFKMCHRLVASEGLMVGGSGGMALVGALRVARKLEQDGVVVVLVPDSGRGYVSKVYADNWLATHGFTESTSQMRVGEALSRTQVQHCELPVVPASATLREAIQILSSSSVGRLPVATVSQPTSIGEIVGSVSLAHCWHICASEVISMDEPIRRFVEPALSILGVGQALDEALASVEGMECSLVLDQGRPIALLHKSDMMRAWLMAHCKRDGHDDR